MKYLNNIPPHERQGSAPEDVFLLKQMVYRLDMRGMRHLLTLFTRALHVSDDLVLEEKK